MLNLSLLWDERLYEFSAIFFIFGKTNAMTVVKTQKKTTSRPRKAATKKAKPKGGLAAIEHFVKTVDKYKLDFSYLKP